MSISSSSFYNINALHYIIIIILYYINTVIKLNSIIILHIILCVLKKLREEENFMYIFIGCYINFSYDI